MVEARAKSHKKLKIRIWDLKTSSSPKIDQITANSFLKFKGALRAHFLGHALHTFKIIISFEGVLMLLLGFLIPLMV